MSETQGTIRLYGMVEDSIVDGPGLRFSVFVQGCTHCCPGCHNPESQDMQGGTVVPLEGLKSKILANELATAVTLTGGEPFEQCAACLDLATFLKERGYNIWIYSGYPYESLMQGIPDVLAPDLLSMCDVLVDGPFVQEKHSYTLAWRGSENQRVIDLAKSKAEGNVVLWQGETQQWPEVPRS